MKIILIKKEIFFSLVSLLLLFSWSNVSAQNKFANVDSLENVIFTLASESMGGRYPGTYADSIAAGYIANKMLTAGLVPLIGDSFLIPFEITLYRQVNISSFLKIGKKSYKLGADFWIHPLSPVSNVKGTVGNPNGTSLGNIAFLETPADSIPFKVTDLKEKGFDALVCFDSTIVENQSTARGAVFSIPVVFVSGKLVETIKHNIGKEIAIESNTQLVKAKTFNIAGITPGNGSSYILAGAHYDHLGLGGEGSGSTRPNIAMVHPGADDNASGVSAILEAARVIMEKRSLDSLGKGFAVVAVGAEERGLLGSSLMADTLLQTGRLPDIMINLDMVGRLRDNKLQAGGVGTFEEADSILTCINDLFNLDLITTKEGSGPSDHSSFNSKKVPVLYFTTGVHREYHTPADSAQLINYEGLTLVTDYIVELVKKLGASTFLPEYVQVEEAVMQARTNFKVTLGIIPDFTYDKGDGFRIGPVSDGRPAHKAGLLEGDIIVSMDDNTIANIYDYMNSLGKLKKGDQVEVCYLRDGNLKKVIIKL